MSTNQLIILRKPNDSLGKSNYSGTIKKKKKTKKSFSPLKSSPFRGGKGGGNGSGRCEIDGLDDTTVDQLLEELDPVLVNSIGDDDSLSHSQHHHHHHSHQMALTSSHHSFHDFRAHSKPLITDGFPYPASSGQTLSFTSSLSRGGGITSGIGQTINRLSFGRPIQPPTAPLTTTLPTITTPSSPMTISTTTPNNSILTTPLQPLQPLQPLLQLQPPPPPPTINCLYHQNPTESNPRLMSTTVNSYF